MSENNEALKSLGMMAKNTNIKNNLTELSDIMRSGGDHIITDINLKNEIDLINQRKSRWSASQRKRLLSLWEKIQIQQKGMRE